MAGWHHRLNGHEPEQAPGVVGKIPRKREWEPTPVFLPGESQGWGSLVGCHLWGRTELDTTKAQKTKIMASGSITSWEIDGETVETVSDFIFWAPKPLQMVTAAMKLKDTYSLEEKL